MSKRKKYADEGYGTYIDKKIRIDPDIGRNNIKLNNNRSGGLLGAAPHGFPPLAFPLTSSSLVSIHSQNNKLLWPLTSRPRYSGEGTTQCGSEPPWKEHRHMEGTKEFVSNPPWKDHRHMEGTTECVSNPPWKEHRRTDGTTEVGTEPPWKEQIRELKEYIVKLENDKSQLNNKVSDFRNQINNDAKMVCLVKEHIEKVKNVQEKEKDSLEKIKIAQLNEKHNIDKERDILEKVKIAQLNEKHYIEKEKELICNERKMLKLDQEEKRKFILNIVNMRKEMGILNRQKLENVEAFKAEEKRHLELELKELELRRAMTKKAIEREVIIEQLEKRLADLNEKNSKLQTNIDQKDSQYQCLLTEYAKLSAQNKTELANLKEEMELQHRHHHLEKESLKIKFDSEYGIFLSRKDGFDEQTKINCVFCPHQNVQTISNYLFHIAREHMFDQYKAVDVKEGSAQVGMLLKILEEKAKKEYVNEIKDLKTCIKKLKTTHEKADTLTIESSETNIMSKGKQEELAKDLDALLEVESNQKHQIEDLRNKHKILQNQIQKLSMEGKHELDSEIVKKRLALVENEVLKGRIAIANDKIADLLKNIKMLNGTIDSLKKIQQAVLRDQNILNSKLKTLEGENDELMGAKTCLESEIGELIAQNRNLEEGGVLKKELEEVKGINLNLHVRLGEAVERIELFEKEMSECLEQKRENDGFLDIGIESFLRTPIEDMSVNKLDDIDSDELDLIEDE